jgi:hypothetical protein
VRGVRSINTNTATRAGVSMGNARYKSKSRALTVVARACEGSKPLGEAWALVDSLLQFQLLLHSTSVCSSARATAESYPNSASFLPHLPRSYCLLLACACAGRSTLHRTASHHQLCLSPLLLSLLPQHTCHPPKRPPAPSLYSLVILPPSSICNLCNPSLFLLPNCLLPCCFRR